MTGKIETAIGDINISANVFARLAGMIASNCYGVVGMAYRNASDGIAHLLKADKITKGIKVDFLENSLAVELHIIVEYGVNIPVICGSIINSVKYHIKNMTGFEVSDVKVFVESVRAN